MDPSYDNKSAWLAARHSKRGQQLSRKKKCSLHNVDSPHAFRNVTLCNSEAAMNQHQSARWGKARRGRLQQQQQPDWCRLTGSQKRNELTVGSLPKPSLHFSGSEITLACLIWSGFSLSGVWTLQIHFLCQKPFFLSFIYIELNRQLYFLSSSEKKYCIYRMYIFFTKSSFN